MEFTLEKIQQTIGSEWTASQRGNQGNIKLEIVSLTDKTLPTPDDDRKLDLLVEARRALRDAGYNCKVSLSQPDKRLRDANGNAVWRGWPSIWVNRVATTVPSAERSTDQVVANTAAIERISDSLDKLLKFMESDANRATPTTEDEAVY